MKVKKGSAVLIFVGLLLIAVFVVGLVCEKNPGAFQRKYRYDFALDQFCAFCVRWWLPAGVIGLPTFLVSLLISLRRESREKQQY